MPERPQPFKFAATTAPGAQVAAGVSSLHGWSLCEAAGAAAKVRLWDNPSAATGQHYGPITFLANESIRDSFGDQEGLLVESSGLWLEVISGSVEGSVFCR